MIFICPVCSQEIIRPNSIMLSADVPVYYNIYLHPDCLLSIDITSEEIINKFKRIFAEGQKRIKEKGASN